MPLEPFPPELLELPDEELGKHVRIWWIANMALQRGISLNPIPQEFAIQVLEATASRLDFEDPTDATLEKALRLIANGDLARGGATFRAHCINVGEKIAALDEAITGRRKQTHIAKQSRQDDLNTWITAELSAHPDIDAKSLLRILESSKKIDRDGIWQDSKGVEHKLSTPQFVQRVKRCRAKLKKL